MNDIDFFGGVSSTMILKNSFGIETPDFNFGKASVKTSPVMTVMASSPHAHDRTCRSRRAQLPEFMLVF